MSALSESLGTGHEYKGHNVSLITQDVKLAFERKLFAKAKDNAKTMKELMDKEEYANHLQKLGDDFMNGGFALESTRGTDFLKTVQGITTLVGLLFSVTEDEALRLVKEGGVEVSSLIRQIIKESYSLTEEELQEAERKAKEEAEEEAEKESAEKKV